MNKSTPNDLSILALEVAKELDTRATRPNVANVKAKALAEELRLLFPGGRPHLPPESMGLVCGVIESWDGGVGSGYEHPTSIAQSIAKKLEKDKLTLKEAGRLIDFCLALHDATESAHVMHDLPSDHPYVLTLA
jgi:hypothetical protein